MKKFTATFLIISVIILVTLQTSSVQKKITTYVEHVLEKESGQIVDIGEISGFFPFFFSISHIKTSSIHVEKLFLIPSFPDIIMGRIGILRAKIDALQVDPNAVTSKLTDQNTKEITPLINYLPLYTFRVYSLACPLIHIDGKLQAEMQGSIFWEPSTQHITYRAHIGASYQNSTPIHGSFHLEISPQKIQGQLQPDHLDGILPPYLQQRQVLIDFTSNHTKILRTIWGESDDVTDDTHTPLLEGSYHVAVEKLDGDHDNVLQALVHSHGEFVFNSADELKLTIEKIECTRFEDSIANNELVQETRDPFVKKLQKTEITYNVQGTIATTLKFQRNNDEIQKVVVDISSPQLAYQDFLLQDLHTSLCWSKQQDKYIGELKIDGLLDRILPADHPEETFYLQYHALPIQATACFESDGSTCVYAKQIRAHIAQQPILQGDLQCFLYPLLIRGTVKSQIADISCFSKIFAKKMSGKGKTSCCFGRIITKDNEYEIQQSMKCTSKWQDIRINATAVKKCSFAIHGQGLLPTANVTLFLDLQDVQINHMKIDSLSLATSCDVSKSIFTIPIHAKAAIKTKEQLNQLSFEGKAEVTSPLTDPQHYVFSLVEAQGLANTRAWVLENPFQIIYDKHGVVIDHFSCKVLNSPQDKNISIQGAGTITQHPLNGSINIGLRFENFSLLPLTCLFPDLPVYGNFSGSIDIFGKKSNPKVHIEVFSNSLAFYHLPSDALRECIGIDLEADITKDLCRATLSINGVGTEKPFEIKLLLPSVFSWKQEDFHILTKAPISGTLDGPIKLSVFKWLVDEDQNFDGLVTCKLKIFGSLTHPKCAGLISLENGMFDIPEIGCRLQQVSIQAKGSQDKILLDHFEGVDGYGGKFYGRGAVFLHPESQFPFSLDLHVSKLLLLDKELITATVSGNGTLKSDTSGMHLGATLELDKGIVNLNTKRPKTLPELEILYTRDGKTLIQPQEKQRPFNLDLDLSIDKNPIAIVGMGLQTDWIGHIVVKEQPENLHFYGNIHHAHGIYSLAGKECHITQGQIEWNGPILTHSKLYMQASCPTTEIAAYIILQGSLEEPKLSVRSLPPLPQKDVLSRIIFNKPVDKISPVEALQLAQLLITIKSQNKNQSLIHKVKKQLRIDTIDITHTPDISADSTKSNSVSVQIGKYISQGVLVKLSKNVAQEVNRVGVEANVSKNIAVQAEFGDDSAGEVRVLWKTDW